MESTAAKAQPWKDRRSKDTRVQPWKHRYMECTTAKVQPWKESSKSAALERWEKQRYTKFAAAKVQPWKDGRSKAALNLQQQRLSPGKVGEAKIHRIYSSKGADLERWEKQRYTGSTAAKAQPWKDGRSKDTLNLQQQRRSSGKVGEAKIHGIYSSKGADLERWEK
ncbi:hypothetical protein NDU88_006433 [Pleurodeles waltl]|uniref:Uncharacterized protein n=1 Tax=Pleurodeles waltl TaxID=8319 RepID=A0AAV7SPU9_PLEWA|nr:hypothetical protein NDU88_006433 [Pleurodeles waltl]